MPNYSCLIVLAIKVGVSRETGEMLEDKNKNRQRAVFIFIYMLRGWDSVTSKFCRRKISPRPRNFDFAC